MADQRCNGWPNRSTWRAALEYLDFDDLRAFALTEIEAYIRYHNTRNYEAIMGNAKDMLCDVIDTTMSYSETWAPDSDDDGVDSEYVAKSVLTDVVVWEGAWWHNGCISYDDSAIFVEFDDAKRYIYEQAEAFEERESDLDIIADLTEAVIDDTKYSHETDKNIYYLRRLRYE